jgi:cysteine desulfurase
MNRVFFDNAATTPIHPDVVKVMTKCLSETYGNPSSAHSYGREAKGQLEESRRAIAKILGAKPSEIFFTSCGTESNNTILRNAIKSDEITEIWTTPIEHPSIYQTSSQICQDIPIEYLELNANGSVNLAKLEEKLNKVNKKVLVSAMHANNEVGVLNDLKSIGELCQKYGALLHSDMVQTMGHLPINFQELKVDFASASAHKFHGPKGVGFMYIRQPNHIEAFITGGSQERGNRSGTENLASIVGMSKALELATSGIDADIVYLNQLRTHLMTKLKANFPSIDFLTKIDESLCTIVSTIFPPEFDSEMLLFQMDMKGVACSGGSACSSGAAKASYVLSHFPIPPNNKVVRFSFSKFNTLQEIDFCINKIKEIASERSQNC